MHLYVCNSISSSGLPHLANAIHCNSVQFCARFIRFNVPASHVLTLTGYKADLGEHNPFDGKVQIDFQIFAHPVVQFDGHIPCMIHYRIGHIGKLHRFTRKVATSDAEEHLGMHKYLVKIWDIVLVRL